MRYGIIFFFLTFVFLQANDKIIATGKKTGNYYKVGLELNQKLFDGKAKVITTSGSVENMLLIAEKKSRCSNSTIRCFGNVRYFL